MINELKQGINFYLTHLGWIDFASYIWLVLLFFTIVFTCFYIMSKHPLAGVLMFILTIFAFLFGAFYLHKFLDENLRQRSVLITDTKQLTYSNTLIVDLNLTNLSANSFKYCSIKLKFYTPSSNFIKNELNKLKPFLKSNLVLKESLDAGETTQEQSVIDGFRFENYDIIATSECY